MTKGVILISSLVLLYIVIERFLYKIRRSCLDQAKLEGQQARAELASLDRPINFDKLTTAIAETIDARWQNRQYYLRQATTILMLNIAFTLLCLASFITLIVRYIL